MHGGRADGCTRRRQAADGDAGRRGTQHGPDEPRTQAKKVDALGGLKLELGSGFYHWKFVPVVGRTYTDSGRARCH
jgi:acid phosphatase type 7